MPWRLLIKNIFGHPVRSMLTFGSLVIAIFLICFLRSLLVGLEAGVAGSASNRLIVQSAVSLFVDLPISYQGKIKDVEGIDEVCKFQWFGGRYRDESGFFAQFGVDNDRFFDAYPEVQLVAGEPADFVNKRTACIVGKGLRDTYGFEVGSKVPIIGTIFSKNDGTAWEFDVVGVYESTSANVDENTMFFHWKYLDETLETGAANGPRGVGVYVLKIEDGADPVAISGRVDELFENGPQRVQTTTEAEFQRQFVSMMGNIPTFISSIGFGVLFAILLAVLNTMLMAGRERTRDFGILKALGFTDAVAFVLLLGESLLLCVAGGAGGIALAKLSEAAAASAFKQLLPTYAVTPETMGLGAAIAVGIGLAAGIAPAWQASRLKPVDALRAEA